MAKLPLIKGVSGLNNKLDAVRIPYNSETGVSALSLCLDFLIDDSGMPYRRDGRSTALSGEYHSIYAEPGTDCFVIKERTSDAAIMQIGTDLSETGVSSGLTKNRRMSWANAEGDIFYCNYFENGYLRNGVSDYWPTETYQGPGNFTFAAAPVGQLVAYKRGGTIFIARDNILYNNFQPFSFGLWNFNTGCTVFPTDIRMVRPTESGVFVSDSLKTFFMRGENALSFSQEKVADYPAHMWSLAHDPVDPSSIGIESKGDAYVWSSPMGICLGLNEGTMINLTQEKLNYPQAYNYAACLIYGKTNVINSMY